jgi:hypothetical protein
MAQCDGRILTIAESITRVSDSAIGKVYKIETTSANGWPDGRSIYHTMAHTTE